MSQASPFFSLRLTCPIASSSSPANLLPKKAEDSLKGTKRKVYCCSVAKSCLTLLSHGLKQPSFIHSLTKHCQTSPVPGDVPPNTGTSQCPPSWRLDAATHSPWFLISAHTVPPGPKWDCSIDVLHQHLAYVNT